jgi:hypothetical protein
MSRSRSHPRPEPKRQSSYLTFTPRRSAIASFDNLVVLANYEEHLREARKMVWRDRGEPAIDIHGIHECFVHGARGALRAFSFRRPLPNFHPLSLCRRWCHRLRYPFRREPGLTIGTYQEIVQVCSHPVFATQTYILLGKSVYLSYGMHSLDQILSVPLPC